MVERALAATTAGQQGRKKAGDNIYDALRLQQVLESVLPSWEQGIEGEAQLKSVTKEVKYHISIAQVAAGNIIHAAKNMSAKQIEFVNDRGKSRG